MTSKSCCAISGFARAGSVFDTLKTVKAAGFDGVDFSFSTYSRKAGEGLCSAHWWRQWVEAVRTYLDELSLPVLQAHAPWEQTVPKDFSEEPPFPVYFRAIEACAMLGCRIMVFHPLLYPWRIERDDLWQPILEYNRRWFAQIVPAAASCGITVALENLFDYYHVQQAGDPACPFTTAAHLRALLEAIDAPNVGFCLDTGHANIAGQNVPGMIRAYGRDLKCLHLNDNYGRTNGIYEDVHLPPGAGTLDWAPIWAALREVGYAGVYDLELIADLKQLDAPSRTARLRAGRAWLEAAFSLPLEGKVPQCAHWGG